MNLKRELSDYLNEDVVKYTLWRREHDNWTYQRIADDLAESGYTVHPDTLASWVYQYRKSTPT